MIRLRVKESTVRGNLGESNTYFKIISPFEVFVKTGSAPSSFSYGSSRLYQGVYRKITTSPGQFILNLHGGVFLADPVTKQAYPVTMEEPDFSPFEKSYGYRKGEEFPLQNMKKVDASIPGRDWEYKH